MGTIRDVLTSILLQNIKIIEGGPFGNNEKFSKKSHSAKKIEVKNTKIAKGGSFVGFRGSRRRFCFGQVCDISGVFWTSVVQAEQMNKKYGPFAAKKLPTVEVGYFSSKAWSKNSNTKKNALDMNFGQMVVNKMFSQCVVIFLGTLEWSIS